MTSVTEKNTTKKGLRKGTAESGAAILHRMLGDGGPQNEVKGGEVGAIQCPGEECLCRGTVKCKVHQEFVDVLEDQQKDW